MIVSELLQFKHLSFESLVVGFVAFLISAVTCLLLMRYQIVDHPNDRSAHQIPTPKSGGIAIILSFLMALFLCFKMDFYTGSVSHAFFTILICSTLMGIVGLVDDMRGLSWFTRILVQFVLALTVVMAGVKIQHFTVPGLGRVELGLWGDFISIFWILAFTNAFNFMDGLNGLTAGSTLIALLGLLLFHDGQAIITFVLSILPFSILGFLIFNFPKGRIFMGDVGSQFLGFFLASLGLILPMSDLDFSQLIMPMLFLIFLFDTGMTIVVKLFKKSPVHQPHRDYLIHVLNRLGWSHRRVSFLYFLFAFLQVMGAFYLQTIQKHFHIFVFVPFLVLYGFYALIVINWARRQGIDLYQSKKG